MRVITWVLVFILIAACSPAVTPRTPTLPFNLLATATNTPPALPSEVSSITPNSTALPIDRPTQTPTPVQISICSPIAGYGRSLLEESISNPFHPPSRIGSDDPHQAIDLAVVQFGISLDGVPVHAMIAGRVAAVISDRFPYGNALLVETSMDELPVEWIGQLDVPTPAPTLGPHPSLTCPDVEIPASWDFTRRSLYLLYAHLMGAPIYELGDAVSCGEQIGEIGQSGNALNPHVHLEARVGPAMANFDSIAHYETRASPEEMWAYCTWRVSGIFQLLDPNNLVQLLPNGD